MGTYKYSIKKICILIYIPTFGTTTYNQCIKWPEYYDIENIRNFEHFFVIGTITIHHIYKLLINNVPFKYWLLHFIL